MEPDTAAGTAETDGSEADTSPELIPADGTLKKQIDKSFVTVKPAIHIVCRGWTACDPDNIRVTE